MSRNSIRDCEEGVHVSRDVDPAWTLGDDNVFANCSVNVLDNRGQVLEEEVLEEEEDPEDEELEEEEEFDCGGVEDGGGGSCGMHGGGRTHR